MAAPGSAGSLGHVLHTLAMRSPGGAALGVRADPRRRPQAAGGHGGMRTRSVEKTRVKSGFVFPIPFSILPSASYVTPLCRGATLC